MQDSSEINDIRTSTQFKGISFSKYKKTEVRTQMVEAMLKGRIEPACNWTAELICAGHFGDVWENILYYMAKHIHLGNPKMAIYLEMRYEVFRNIMGQGHYLNELEVRNNDKIRKLFAEIICILSTSPRKPSFESVKINREEEFDMTQMTDRLKAPFVKYAEPIFKKGDPKELFIAINEFSYCISGDNNNNNMITAFYWIEWVVEFDILCKKRKLPCVCEKRTEYPIETKYRKDIIWLIWESIIHYSRAKNNPLVDKIINSLLRLFCIKYTTAACKKRRYMLYYAVELLIEPMNSTVEIISDKIVLQNVTNKINEVYKQIKKNEEAPKTDYLFNGLDKQRALDRSLAQMEIMAKMDPVNGNQGLQNQRS
jgi:hypothetical protein